MGLYFSFSRRYEWKWPLQFLLHFFVAFSGFCDNSVNGYAVSTCGTLYSEAKSQGIAFPLKDGDIYGDLANDERIYGSGWTVTGSVEIEYGCKLEVCNETYFNGDCYTLEEGSHSVTENGFLDGSASAQCTCEKECNCADVHVERTLCGRAYLERGCRDCNALYMPLEQERLVSFPVKLWKSVKTIRLRKGCTLTYYSQSPYTPHLKGRIIQDEIVEGFDKEIRFYQCKCVDELYEPPRRHPRPKEYPELVELPDKISDISVLLRNDTYKHHPGVNAALRSYRKGRSSRNAYILVLGSAGDGKSTAIQLLLDNNTVRIVHNSGSPARESQIRVPVPIDNLGVANSQLRIIDTPGLHGDYSSDYDAEVLATLDEFLMSHEELKNRIPNAVLIFHKFGDKTIEEQRAPFNVMLHRYRQKLKSPITDEKYSNVVFVLSRYCAVEPMEERQPEKILKSFKRVIQEYSGFPGPVHIVTGEIRSHGGVLSINGQVQLPNKVLYPRNLVEKLELITDRGGDEIGRGIFWNAFQKSAVLTVAMKTIYPMLARRKDWGNYSSRETHSSVMESLNKTEPNVNVSELVARIDKLEKELADERKARVDDLEIIKTNLIAGQLSMLRDAVKTMNKMNTE